MSLHNAIVLLLMCSHPFSCAQYNNSFASFRQPAEELSSTVVRLLSALQVRSSIGAHQEESH